MNRWRTSFIIIAGLLGGCSTSSKPEDPNIEANVDLSDVPARIPYDSAVPFTFAIIDLDGLQSVHVQYMEDGKVVWTENIVNGNKFETSWLPSAESPTSARLAWEYSDAHPDTESNSGSFEIEILDTRFAEGSLNIFGRFGGAPNGYMTVSTLENKKVASIQINDGVVTYDRSHKIDADSLENGLYRNLIEADGYPLTSYPHTDRNYEVVPWNAQDWSYEDVLSHMSNPATIHVEQGAQRTITRWPNGSNIFVPLYDQQYFDYCSEDKSEGLCAYDSTDENLLASQEYIDNCSEAYNRLNNLIEQINLEIQLQSESDEEFPQKIGQQNVITITGRPNAIYAITRSDKTQDGAIEWAYAMQETNPPATNVQVPGVLADGLENLGPATTGQGGIAVDYNSALLTPFGEKLAPFWYDYPIGTGEYTLETPLKGQHGSVSDIPLYIPK
ncbi:MAG: hypothetical protein GVY07_10730 [Bacteroidetes bacterium]|jgi:hypothetical protein|nr:hypothetical protein [Bacteroidota bacterium]